MRSINFNRLLQHAANALTISEIQVVTATADTE